MPDEHVFNLKERVDILPDDYCIPEDVGNVTLQTFNCTEYQGDGPLSFNGKSGFSRRSIEAGTYARVFPQVYRWRRGSTITIAVERNTKPVLIDLNLGIPQTPPAYVLVRASEITAAAMSKAYKYWNKASIGVNFAWTMDLGRSTYVVRTGGTRGTALATADYPPQANGYQRLIRVWDSMLEFDWLPVGPNIISHELGHVLGLAHNDDASDKVFELWQETGFSIMDSGLDPDTNVITEIPARDVGGARILYNQMKPPTTRNRTVVVLTPPQGPNLIPPFIRFCKWGVFGICIYY